MAAALIDIARHQVLAELASAEYAQGTHAVEWRDGEQWLQARVDAYGIPSVSEWGDGHWGYVWSTLFVRWFPLPARLVPIANGEADGSPCTRVPALSDDIRPDPFLCTTCGESTGGRFCKCGGFSGSSAELLLASAGVR